MSKIRININVTEKQKSDIQKRADALHMTVTDYILKTALDHNEVEVVNDQQERVSDLLRYIATLEAALQRAESKYDDMHSMAVEAQRMTQILQMKSMPFYKRIFTKGIENK
jgi:uncharacterized protein (DUF1778 family)